MKAVCSVLALLSLISLILAVESAENVPSTRSCVPFEVVSSWTNNYHLLLKLPVPTTVTSWSVTIQLSAPVSGFQCWTANVSPTSGTTITLKNKSYNGQQSAGTVLSLGVLVTYYGSFPIITSLTFNGQSLGGLCGVSAETTPAPTVQPSSCVPYAEVSSWDNNYHLTINVTVPVSTTSWNIVLQFSSYVTTLQAWLGIVSPFSGTSITLTNQNYNGAQTAGNVLSIGFIVTYYGPKPDLTSVTFNGVYLGGLCGATATPPPTEAPTTQAPTTQAPTTQAPTTQAPTTQAPTTQAPTTQAPTTQAPTTPSTTTQPTTQPPTEATTTQPPTTATTTQSPTDSGNCFDFIETNNWNNNYQGNILVTVPLSVTSWTLVLQLSSNVDYFQAWTANVSPTSGTTITLTNMGYNGVQSAGSILQLGVQVTYYGSVPSITSATFNGVDLGGNCGVNSTPSPTTSPTDSTAATTSGPTSASTQTEAPPTQGPTSPPGSGCVAPGTTYDYDEVLRKSLLFYEAQRSGVLPPTQRVTWRKDSAVDDAKDSETNVQKDLEGGYYDAGDYGKFGYPMAGTITVLAWGAIDYGNAYVQAGEMSYMKEAVKWGTDYFIKAHVSPNVLYGQVGNGQLDHNYWGRPEDMTMARPAYKLTASRPGSDLVGETAAAMAAASILFRDSDSAYADECLRHAEELYYFANTYRGDYDQVIPGVSEFYASYGYYDELAWAAAWLYRATGKTSYLTDAKAHYQHLWSPSEFSWAEKTPGVQVLLAQLSTGSDKTKYETDLKNFCDTMVDQKPRTPKGLLYLSQWGSLRYSANVAFVCLRAADLGLNTAKYRNFGRQQIHYMLGDTGRSYVVGFGVNPPLRPHHAAASCSLAPVQCDWDDFHSPDPNPQVLYGALVGGPDANDYYVDRRDDYIMNEVACDYNAGFQSAVAALRFHAGC